jgi:hypothetical protein
VFSSNDHFNFWHLLYLLWWLLHFADFPSASWLHLLSLFLEKFLLLTLKCCLYNAILGSFLHLRYGNINHAINMSVTPPHVRLTSNSNLNCLKMNSSSLVPHIMPQTLLCPLSQWTASLPTVSQVRNLTNFSSLLFHHMSLSFIRLCLMNSTFYKYFPHLSIFLVLKYWQS